MSYKRSRCPFSYVYVLRLCALFTADLLTAGWAEFMHILYCIIQVVSYHMTLHDLGSMTLLRVGGQIASSLHVIAPLKPAIAFWV